MKNKRTNKQRKDTKFDFWCETNGDEKTTPRELIQVILKCLPEIGKVNENATHNTHTHTLINVF